MALLPFLGLSVIGTFLLAAVALESIIMLIIYGGKDTGKMWSEFVAAVVGLLVNGWFSCVVYRCVSSIIVIVVVVVTIIINGSSSFIVIITIHHHHHLFVISVVTIITITIIRGIPRILVRGG